jgi:hypothetical protein
VDILQLDSLRLADQKAGSKVNKTSLSTRKKHLHYRVTIVEHGFQASIAPLNPDLSNGE